mgnify:CR=1 FL=1
MTRALLVAVIGLVAASTLWAQEPRFSVRADIVSLDVWVGNRSAPVTDLRPDEFEVRDNGTLLPVLRADYAVMPVDVTLVIDMSASVRGTLLTALSNAVDAVQARLGPRDTVHVIRFDHRIAEQRVDTGQAVSAQLGPPGGQTALMDALVASLIRPRDPSRRQLLILFTDGADTISFVDESMARAVALRSDAAVFVVAASDRNIFDMPHAGFLEAITRATGGRLAVLSRESSLSPAFIQSLDEFRQSYVVQYVLPGQPQPGWHDVDVRVSRPGTFTVRARRGYVASSTMPVE